MSATHVEYYHLELDEFDVVQAHGVFSESWADGGNRSFFENVKVTELKPGDSIRRQADRPGFALMRDKKTIRELNLRLGKQARLFKKRKQHKIGISMKLVVSRIPTTTGASL